jgi:RimJ/RimL family protein N-acetyltransferase
LIRQPPRIETERLILREFRQKDLDAQAATLRDEEVMRHMGSGPIDREDSWRRLLCGVGMWSMIGMGPWAVTQKSDGRMVGHVGFFQFERDIEPSILGEPEMGWIFDRSVHGQGVATEACRAALEWADTQLGAPSYPAIISLHNVPSIRLAERLGFVRQPDAIYKDERLAFYRRAAAR